MKRLFHYLKGYTIETILGPLFKLLEATLELLIPIVVKQIIDQGINQNNKVIVIQYSILLIVMAIVGLVFSITAQYFAAKASVGFVSKIRHGLFQHIGTLSYQEIDQLGSSTLITRMTSDMNQVQNGMNLTLRLLLRSPFVVVGAMIMAFTIDVKSALVFAFVIPFLAGIVFLIMKISAPLYKKVQQGLDQVLKSTRENLNGSRVIRAFVREKEEVQEFQEKNKQLVESQKKVGRISSLLNPLTYAIINFAILFLIYIGALQVNQGILTQGAVVALYNYMSQILVELIKFANLIITISKSIACGNRIQNVFEIQSSLKENTCCQKEERNTNILRFDHVFLRYQNGGEDALKDVSFTVKKGETLGIIGGTGSGKTSLVHLIPRFYEATKGNVFYYETNVKEYNSKFLHEQIGMVPQKAVLFQGSIRDNLKWGNKNATDEEIYEALKIAQALDVVEKKEGKLDYLIEQGGKNLSGGQKQRLCIARALVKKPDILILDDSSSALDFATDAALRQALGKIKTGCVVIVSQRTSSIASCNQIICLDHGQVMGIGTHEQLLHSCEVYREIYESQFKKEGGDKIEK